MSATIHILVVDDHPVVRDGLVAVLNTQPDFEVIGDAGDGLAAVEAVKQLNPEVVLLDLEMPKLDGVDAIKQMRDDNPEIGIIVFTAFDTDERILGAVEAGAQGYLLKGARREEIFNAIRVVHDGGSLLQPVIATKLMRKVNKDKALDEQMPVEALTPREMEVLEWMARGLQNKEIATELVISERTVKFHVSSILGKLGAGNRTEAVTLAMQRGIIDVQENG
jgi:DNA-binding NarL/FixJ family response regulator